MGKSVVGDQILIFVGGGMRSSTTSEATGQVVRFGGFPDDQSSVMSFATMIIMGDLGFIFETYVLVTDDNMNTLNDNRGWMFMKDEIFTVMDPAVVDITSEATSSEASGPIARSGQETTIPPASPYSEP